MDRSKAVATSQTSKECGALRILEVVLAVHSYGSQSVAT